MLRRRPLRVVATWPSRYPDVYDNRAQAAKARMVRAAWQRHLTPFRAHHSQLDVRVEATPGSILNYLARQRHRIGLAVVPGIRATGIAEFLDVSRDAGAADLCFDVLICAPSCPNYVA